MGVSGKPFSHFVLQYPVRKMWSLFVCEKAAHENVSLTSVPTGAQALQNIMAICVHTRYGSRGQIAGEDSLRQQLGGMK